MLVYLTGRIMVVPYKFATDERVRILQCVPFSGHWLFWISYSMQLYLKGIINCNIEKNKIEKQWTP